MALPIKKRQNLLEENSPRGIFRVSWSPTRFSTLIIPAGKKVSSPKIANREISASCLELYFHLLTSLCLQIVRK